MIAMSVRLLVTGRPLQDSRRGGQGSKGIVPPPPRGPSALAAGVAVLTASVLPPLSRKAGPSPGSQ